MPNDRWKICRLFYRSNTKEPGINHYWEKNTDFLIIILFSLDI